MYEDVKYTNENYISDGNVVMVFYSQLELMNSNLEQKHCYVIVETHG